MSISEIKVGTIVKFKIGKNLILAEVIEVLETGFLVQSTSTYKTFFVPASKIAVDEKKTMESVTKPDSMASDSGESKAPVTEPEPVEAIERGSAPVAEQIPEHPVEEQEPVEEFQPTGDDEEDEYVINPAHESDKPVKRLSLLNAAIIVLRETKTDMNTRELIEAVVERQLWTPTECKTPEQSLYGSIFREIATKERPRIVKSEIKGKFRIAE